MTDTATNNFCDAQDLALENGVAIAAAFFTSRDYPRFYKKFGEQMGGFPAIWKWIAQAAVIFTMAEHEYDGEYQWIDAIDSFAASLVGVDEQPTDEEIRVFALAAIK